MDPRNQEALRQRITAAAEQALAARKFVTAIDILGGIGWLNPTHVAEWRQGRLPFLEAGIQANLSRVSEAMSLFRAWARERGLNPSETVYTRATRHGRGDLRFSESGDPAIERAYRTHYVSPELSEAKRARLAEKSAAAPDRVVFEILSDSACSECGAGVPRGGLLWLEAGQPFCLACANLADLNYLARGDATLTRRAAKKSSRGVVVVVRFSRSRGRYERQGILVEEAALAAAEAECDEDGGARAVQRTRAAAARVNEDQLLATRMAARILELFPRCPPAEAQRMAQWTATRGSGRVGRTAAGRELAEAALTAAVHASVRHVHTNYDELLAAGLERESARAAVRTRVEEVLSHWRLGDRSESFP